MCMCMRIVEQHGHKLRLVMGFPLVVLPPELITDHHQTPMKQYKNARGEGKLFSVDLLDEKVPTYLRVDGWVDGWMDG